jgi:hypothetical protein
MQTTHETNERAPNATFLECQRQCKRASANDRLENVEKHVYGTGEHVSATGIELNCREIITIACWNDQRACLDHRSSRSLAHHQNRDYDEKKKKKKKKKKKNTCQFQFFSIKITID